MVFIGQTATTAASFPAAHFIRKWHQMEPFPMNSHAKVFNLGCITHINIFDACVIDIDSTTPWSPSKNIITMTPWLGNAFWIGGLICIRWISFTSGQEGGVSCGVTATIHMVSTMPVFRMTKSLSFQFLRHNYWRGEFILRNMPVMRMVMRNSNTGTSV